MGMGLRGVGVGMWGAWGESEDGEEEEEGRLVGEEAERRNGGARTP